MLSGSWLTLDLWREAILSCVCLLTDANELYRRAMTAGEPEDHIQPEGSEQNQYCTSLLSHILFVSAAHLASMPDRYTHRSLFNRCRINAVLLNSFDSVMLECLTLGNSQKQTKIKDTNDTSNCAAQFKKLTLIYLYFL